MRFQFPWWLSGMALGLVVAVFLLLGGIRLLRAIKMFGDQNRIDTLITFRAGNRRALKAGLMVAATALAFVAAAGPQYGRGTRLIPRTSLDVVIALDYSKSMYARDVSPSRSERAKVEVARLIRELPGARFGAVAFAGDTVSFPLTSDGGAIAQFFRQLTPNDMPVGGTAIGRAIEASRQLLLRDPSSSKHQRVIIVVTDGEDMEGDPIAAAKSAAGDNIVVNVVQIGGRTPEPIPDVAEDGTVRGIRNDGSGSPLTTSLTAEGEAQLTEVAKASNGAVVRSERGETGLDEITRAMKRMMTEELSERVETVYADVFHYPLILCLLFLLLDLAVTEAPRKKHAPRETPPASAPSLTRRKRQALLQTTLLMLVGLSSSGCERVERTLFWRFSPQVDQAIAQLAKDEADAAAETLETYLATGKCENGELGTPESVRSRPEAALDLSLALFQVAEQFGARFTDPMQSPDANDAEQTQKLSQRSAQVDCALRVVRILAAQEALSPTLRAQANYLSGNLEFLRFDFGKAVESYNVALRLLPAEEAASADAPRTISQDAAYNRAIALRRAEEKKKKEEEEKKKQQQEEKKDEQNKDNQEKNEQDKEEQDKNEPDKPEDQKDDQQKPDEQDSQDNQEKPADGQAGQGAGGQSGADSQPEGAGGQEQAAQEPKPADDSPSLSQDQRILDMLEEAPTLQQENAKRLRGRVRQTMEDK